VSKRTKWLLSIGVIAALVIGWQIAAFASHTAVAPISGNFESNDGNTPVNDAGLDDWDSVNATIKADSLTGSTDESFTQGTKEDTKVPSIEFGSIPPNKSDLTEFRVYQNKGIDGDDYLYLLWQRSNTLGSANMDFEFNQSSTLSNGQTPVRTKGDMLITFDFAQGGNTVKLGLLRWLDGTSPATEQCFANGAKKTDGCWGNFKDLNSTAGISDGAVRDDQKLGEAAINLTDTVFGTDCVNFGKAYLKSRSSDSFTAALKDFVPPANVNVSNCGSIIIDKVTVPNPDPTDTEFPMRLTGGPSALDQSFSLTNDDPVHNSGGVKAGSGYVAAETTPLPPGWQLDSATCDDGSPVTNINVSVGETVTCTFTNSKQETNISTTQSFIPLDSATITGSPPDHFNGTVEWRLYGGDTCSDNTLFEDLTGTNNTLSDANSGVTVHTENDGTASSGTKDGYTNIATDTPQGNGHYSWKVNYVPATGETHPPSETCKEVSTVTIDNDNSN
jgi:hypothetical protein